MDFVGVDIGASGTKVISQQGRIDKFDNNAVVLDKDAVVRFEPYDDTLDSALWAKISKNGQSQRFPISIMYGQMAERQSSVNIRPSVQQKKYVQDINYASIITAAAISRIKFGTPETFTLYVAVPPAEIFKATEAFKEELVGDFTVEFPKYNGGTTVSLKVEDVKCEQESVMAMLSFFFSINGTIKEPSKKFMTGYTLGVNIGASTSDLVVTKNGQYQEKTGRTIAIGGNMARDRLIELVDEEYEFELPFEEAEKVMATGRLTVGNSMVDVSALVRQAKDTLAEELVVKMDSYFKSVNIPIKLLRGIVMSGGGSLAGKFVGEDGKEITTTPPMSEFVADRLKGWCDTLDVAEYGDEARLADLKGLFIKAQLDSKIKEREKEQFKI